MDRKKLATELKELLFPSLISCIVCGDDLPCANRYGLCSKCSLTKNIKHCSRCGRHLNSVGEYCDDCIDNVRYFDEARSAVIYEKDVLRVVRRFKYGNCPYLAATLKEYMLDTLLETFWDFDIITFVPMHIKRLRSRGYNQSQLLAEQVAQHFDIPCLPLLVKPVKTKNLARLGKRARVEAIRGSIVLLPDVDIKNKRILLVDDVFTTGATTNECAYVLKNQGGASLVYALTFASTHLRPRRISEYSKPLSKFNPQKM